jgi:hypothetical protein
MKRGSWENVGEDLDRHSVPDGWVYRSTTAVDFGQACSVALTLMPRPARRRRRRFVLVSTVRQRVRRGAVDKGE